MSVTITYSAALVAPGGALFEKAMQFAMTGSLLTYNSDYTEATQVLDSDGLVDIDTVKTVVAGGGDVEGYSLYAKMTPEEYTSTLVSLEGDRYLPVNEVFEFAYNPAEEVMLIDDGETKERGSQPSELYVLNSVNSEYLSAAKFIGLFGDTNQILDNKTIYTNHA